MEAENTHKVFDWLWTSGQLSISDLQSLPSLGFDAVINLALPTSSNAVLGEAEIVTGLGLTYIQIPVQWENPEIDKFYQLVNFLESMQGKKVWLHCAKNMRVSAFVYLYRRLILAENHEAAVYPMKEVWQPNDIWQAFIEKVLAQHSNRSFNRTDAPKFE